MPLMVGCLLLCRTQGSKGLVLWPIYRVNFGADVAVSNSQ
jgi:hypothetical protein